jgi:hypothetical protein
VQAQPGNGHVGELEARPHILGQDEGRNDIYRSSSYASQRSNSAFVEISERSAETARLLQEAEGAEPASPTKRTRSWARRVVSEGIHLLAGLGTRVTRLLGETQRSFSSSILGRVN